MRKLNDGNALKSNNYFTQMDRQRDMIRKARAEKKSSVMT
jgi:hypothetical protein